MADSSKPMPDILGMSLYESLHLRDYSPYQIVQLLTFHSEELNEHSISSIDCFCEKCDKSTTFKSRNSSKEDLEKIYLKFKSCEWFDRRSEHLAFHFDSFLPTLQEIEFFTRSFYCPRAPKDSTHDVSIILRVSEDQVIKIGQFPQLADLVNTHLKKYRFLDKEMYQELNRATGLNSHGIGVGSFVYLRRIIEKHIVYPEIDKILKEGTITHDQVTNSDFKGKVSLAKDHLPHVLVDNPRIYSILSKGIHSLSEQECLEMFNPLLTAIELILDERLEKVERAKKVEKIKSELNRISN